MFNMEDKVIPTPLLYLNPNQLTWSSWSSNTQILKDDKTNNFEIVVQRAHILAQLHKAD